MKIIQVFAPSLCCSTGVCGVEVDQALIDFAADVDWAKQNATPWLPFKQPSRSASIGYAP